jgi:hypothetical protein
MMRFCSELFRIDCEIPWGDSKFDITPHHTTDTASRRDTGLAAGDCRTPSATAAGAGTDGAPRSHDALSLRLSRNACRCYLARNLKNRGIE